MSASSLSRLRWVLSAVCVLTMPRLTDGAPADVSACRSITDAAARLACFDKASEPNAAAPAPATPAVSAPTAAAPSAVPTNPRPDPKQQFGLPEVKIAKQEVAAGTRAADANKIEAKIVRVAETADGRAVLSLDNHQVWRQLTADGDLMVKQGDTVTISRALFGSYWLATSTKRGCKVDRIH